MLRTIWRQRGYTALVVVTLTLAVGANLVVFALTNAIWLKPRGMADIGRLVAVLADTSNSGTGDSFAFAELGIQQEIRDVPAFAAAAGQVLTSGTHAAFLLRLTPAAVGHPVESLGVTWQYFAVLGLTIRGRDFSASDDLLGAEPAVIISDRLWKSAFDGRQDVVGQIVEAVPSRLRIVGVAPPDFQGARLGEHVDVWLTRSVVQTLSGAGGPQGTPPLLALARLAPGASTSTAERGIEDALRARNRARNLTVVPLAQVYGTPDQGTRIVRESAMLGVIVVTALVVLAGGCATLLALVVVHYERRRGEFAVRLALGASRIQLARLLAFELTLFMALGALGAIVFARESLAALPSLPLPGGVDVSRLDLGLDVRLACASVATAAFVLILAAALPLIRFTQPGLASSLVTARATASTSSLRLRRLMLAVHVGCTVVTLVAAGLFVRTIVFGFSLGPGFDTAHTLFVELNTRAPYWSSRQRDPVQEAADAARQRAFRQFLDTLRALPSVRGLAMGAAPIGADQARAVLNPVTLRQSARVMDVRTGTMWVSPDYLDTLGVAIVAGRAFTAADALETGDRPVIVSETLAALFWPGRSPVGERFSGSELPLRVVGVSRHVAYGSLRADRPEIFIPSINDDPRISRLNLAIRTDDPDSLATVVSRLIAERFPDATRVDIATGTAIVARDLGRERLGALFFSGFGVVALVLGVAGVFGLVAYLAEARRRELGIRMALGATTLCLMSQTISTALVPVAMGAAVGLVGAGLLARSLESFLLGVTRLDPLTYAAAAALMLIAAVSAGLAAAVRIRRVSPLEALRAE